MLTIYFWMMRAYGSIAGLFFGLSRWQKIIMAWVLIAMAFALIGAALAAIRFVASLGQFAESN